MSSERGFALISALWLVVIISVVALEMSLSARNRRLAAANTMEGLQVRAAAEAGVEHAKAKLQEVLHTGVGRGTSTVALAGTSDPWRRPGRLFERPQRMGDATYRVTLRDAGTALNPNWANEEEVRRLLTALRVDFGRADRIAQAMMDWRDPDDEHRARGAERDAYLDAASPMLPRNGPFQDLGELRHISGLDEQTYERVRPFLTLRGTGRINLNAADREVLLSLEGMSSEAVAVVLRSRRQGRPLQSLEQLRRELATPARRQLDLHRIRLTSRVTFETTEVEVFSEGSVEGSPVRSVVEGLFVRAGTSTFLVWRRAA